MSKQTKLVSGNVKDGQIRRQTPIKRLFLLPAQAVVTIRALTISLAVD